MLHNKICAQLLFEHKFFGNNFYLCFDSYLHDHLHILDLMTSSTTYPSATKSSPSVFNSPVRTVSCNVDPSCWLDLEHKSYLWTVCPVLFCFSLAS